MTGTESSQIRAGMKRRHFLTALAGVSLAGCQAPGTDIIFKSTPSSTPTPSPTPTPFETQLRTRLESDNVDVNLDVVHVDVSNGSGVLEYRAGAPTQEVMAREMANVAAIYANLVVEGHPVAILNVTIRNIAGTAIATYRVDAEWVRDLQAGEITTREYLRRVLESFERVEAVTRSPSG